MFEKEADEYFETECLHSYADTEEQLKEDVVTAFQKGAEFGYNKAMDEMQEQGLALQSDMDKTIEQNIALKKELEKANEWHYVKDGDLPKAYQKCYFIYSNNYGEDNKVIFSESNINVLTGIYAFILDEETGEETTEPCFYDDINDDEIDLKEVYAWKEIVLPNIKED